MRGKQIMRLRLALSLSLILIASQNVLSETVPVPAAAPQVPRSQSILDLVVSGKGDLQGLAVNRQGALAAGIRVSLLDNQRVLQTVTTDKSGRFLFRSVELGPKVIRANKISQTVRIWEQRTAPPNAKPELLFVAGSAVVRGQGCATASCDGCDACSGGCFQGHFGGAFQRMLQNPWLIGAGTAAAIAIPLATDDDDEQDDDFAALPIGS